jgi:hypothetical protein
MKSLAPFQDSITFRPSCTSRRSSRLVQIAAEEGGAQCLAEFDQRLVRGVLQIRAGEAAQDVRRGCGAESERCRVLDYLVVLPADQVPVDRPRQHRPQAWVRVGLTRDRTIEPLRVNALESRQQLEAEQVAEGKGNVALPAMRERFYSDPRIWDSIRGLHQGWLRPTV